MMRPRREIERRSGRREERLSGRRDEMLSRQGAVSVMARRCSVMRPGRKNERRSGRSNVSVMVRRCNVMRHWREETRTWRGSGGWSGRGVFLEGQRQRDGAALQNDAPRAHRFLILRFRVPPSRFPLTACLQFLGAPFARRRSGSFLQGAPSSR